jgi:hypothetical protein
MLAYLNRAQIGHQIAMAHLVTLGSWSAFGGTQARQAGVGNPPAYLIALLFGPAQGAAYQAARQASGFDALAQSEGELARAYAAHDQVVRQVFGRVQEDIVAGLPGARWQAMQAILAQNYPGFAYSPQQQPAVSGAHAQAAPASLPASSGPPGLQSGHGFNLAIIDDNWPGYVQSYSSQQPLRPFIQSVAGLYDFLSPRNHTASNAWQVDARCPMLRHELRRRGSTEIDPYGNWQSIDTQSYHALRSNRWIGCYRREYPMGWGWIPSTPDQSVGDPYTDNPPDDFAAQDFWRWVKEATNWDIVSGDANPLANSKAVASRQRWQGGGLPAYYDISQDNRKVSGRPLRFTLELKHPGPEGLTVTTHSAAETFFERPQRRTDGRPETDNLFHPYWQARLASYSASIGNGAGTP